MATKTFRLVIEIVIEGDNKPNFLLHDHDACDGFDLIRQQTSDEFCVTAGNIISVDEVPDNETFTLNGVTFLGNQTDAESEWDLDENSDKDLPFFQWCLANKDRAD